jgi:alkaline phosphatase
MIRLAFVFFNGNCFRYLVRNYLVACLALCSITVEAVGQTSGCLNKQQTIQSTGEEDSSVDSIRNIILMIPDGCSLATVSAARWYQWLLHPDQPFLAIDPYICGTVRTFSSNAPIGDSAPTTSCYMTGQPSRAGFVATYPPADSLNDIIPVNPQKAYQPLMTILEASRLLYGKSTGLVVTCEFPHATPADCSAHAYNRNDYVSIASQMVHNQLDIMFGGGTDYLIQPHRDYLQQQGYMVQMNDLKGFRSFTSGRLWSLFGKEAMPCDLDRDTTMYPSLEEMTAKAIQLLAENKQGFFLMVEGSKIDWAAHTNDPIGMVTEFIAFDKACRVAMDFARKEAHTVVIIVPDHGNSGISIGTNRLSDYTHLSANQLFGHLLNYRRTAAGLADLLNEADYSQVKEIVKTYTGIRLNEDQLHRIELARDYTKSPVPVEKRRNGPYLDRLLAQFMTDPTGFGFTTNGHTGEDVFLAAYHPGKTVPQGVHFNWKSTTTCLVVLVWKGS